MVEVIFEDNHFLVLNKPNGISVQADNSGDKPLEDFAKEYIKTKYDKPGNVFLGVSHRLDRPVSGVVVFSKTSKALVRLNEIFKSRNISKTYWAIVKGKPEIDEQELVHWIKKDSKKNFSRVYDTEVNDSQKAILKYKTLKSLDNYSLLEIELFTGRHHQIRAQLAKIGCVIKGDNKYGFPRGNPDGSISLHARKIAFEHPVSNEKIEITAPVPEKDIWSKF
jgi:23S rRNA pseudouridine1911/1915/1917 synthase